MNKMRNLSGKIEFSTCNFISQGVWNMPATEYGKYLKKIRIDKDNTLAAMAKDMGIAPSYLSAIESGERVIPVDFTEKISEKYSLDDTAKDELRELELKTPRNALQLDFKKSGQHTRTKTKIPAAKIVRRVPDVFMTVLSVLLMGGTAFAR